MFQSGHLGASLKWPGTLGDSSCLPGVAPGVAALDKALDREQEGRDGCSPGSQAQARGRRTEPRGRIWDLWDLWDLVALFPPLGKRVGRVDSEVAKVGVAAEATGP